MSDDEAFYVGHGHSLAWARWWLAFMRDWNPRMTREEERAIFLIGDRTCPFHVDDYHEEELAL